MISRKVGYLKYAHRYGPHPGEPLENRRRFWRKSLDIAIRDLKEATAAQDKRRVRLASKHCQEAKDALAYIEKEVS